MTEQRDQDDVLRKKDRTTQGSIGLQQWDVDADQEAIGTAGSGTAARAARIGGMQKDKAGEAAKGEDGA